MDFKWIFTAAVIFGVTIIAVSWIGWGFWGAFSHIYAIILTGIGAAIILLSRTGQRRRRTIDAQDEPFTGYPEGQMLGIFESRDELGRAIRDLRSAGFANEQVVVYAGLSGAAGLDSEGTAHGLAGIAQRSVEHLMSDVDDLERYDDAVRRGEVVASVHVPDEQRRAEAARIFERRGGHDIYYFGALAVQQMDVDRDRTTTDETTGRERLQQRRLGGRTS